MDHWFGRGSLKQIILNFQSGLKKNLASYSVQLWSFVNILSPVRFLTVQNTITVIAIRTKRLNYDAWVECKPWTGELCYKWWLSARRRRYESGIQCKDNCDDGDRQNSLTRQACAGPERRTAFVRMNWRPTSCLGRLADIASSTVPLCGLCSRPNSRLGNTRCARDCTVPCLHKNIIFPKRSHFVARTVPKWKFW